jgi:hypothetical protein
MKINLGFESITYPVRTVTSLSGVGIISALPMKKQPVKKSSKVATLPSKTAPSVTIKAVSKNEHGFSSEMERQYREWRRGGAAGPSHARTLWAEQFEKRLKKDLTGK